ncbi:MAG TPA: hypothetical protein VFF07_06095 [Actinomycetota bacterium]|nr:hypothetical protein [Actinomycetota bacterium]
MAIGSLLKKTAAVYAAKKGYDAIQRARQPEPRRSPGGKLGTATAVALIGGAGIFLARSGRLPAIPDIIRRKISPGFDSASNGDGQFTESSTLADRPI